MVRGILSALLGEYIELQGRMWFTSPRPVPPLAVGVNVSSAKAEVLLASPLPQPLLRFCPDLYYHLTEMMGGLGGRRRRGLHRMMSG